MAGVNHARGQSAHSSPRATTRSTPAAIKESQAPVPIPARQPWIRTPASTGGPDPTPPGCRAHRTSILRTSKASTQRRRSSAGSLPDQAPTGQAGKHAKQWTHFAVSNAGTGSTRIASLGHTASHDSQPKCRPRQCRHRDESISTAISSRSPRRATRESNVTLSASLCRCLRPPTRLQLRAWCLPPSRPRHGRNRCQHAPPPVTGTAAPSGGGGR